MTASSDEFGGFLKKRSRLEMDKAEAATEEPVDRKRKKVDDTNDYWASFDLSQCVKRKSRIEIDKENAMKQLMAEQEAKLRTQVSKNAAFVLKY